VTEEIDLLQDIASDERDVGRDTLEAVILLAIEIAREGREGRKVGTMFVVSDIDSTLEKSTSLILDPLWYHPSHLKRIGDPNLRETVKELSQLDGAFLVSADGIVISACRYISASSEGIELPLGLGSRHMAAASISAVVSAPAQSAPQGSLLPAQQRGDDGGQQGGGDAGARR